MIFSIIHLQSTYVYVLNLLVFTISLLSKTTCVLQDIAIKALKVGTMPPQSGLSRIDPFRLFPPEIVGLINHLLDPPDTERLRRVCRSWKALSQFSNGYGTMARYCPAVYTSMLADGSLPTADTANACFRRWLCYERSIAAGFAHRVFRFCEVTMFEIRNHILVSGNSSGRLLVRKLHSGSADFSQQSYQLSLKKILRPFIAVEFSLMGVLATGDGDLIIHTETKLKSQVARITSTGKVVWFVEQEYSGAVIGANSVYHFHCGPGLGRVCALETMDLTTGVQKSYSRVAWPSRAPKSFGSFKLVLSADEAFLAVKLKNQLLCIFKTSTGQLAHVEEPEPLGYTAYDDCWMSSEPDSPDFLEACWEQGRVSIIYLYTHQVSTGIFHRTRMMSFAEDSSAPRGRVDIRRGLVFEEQSDEHGVSSFLVRPLEALDPDGTGNKKASCPKNLTMAAGKSRERKPVELPRRRYEEDYEQDSNSFGFYDGYLVFHHIVTGRLMVADFRPPW